MRVPPLTKQFPARSLRHPGNSFIARPAFILATRRATIFAQNRLTGCASVVQLSCLAARLPCDSQEAALAMKHKNSWIGEEADALRALNPVAAILYLFVLASAVTAFLH